jgi:hypothetical protein
MIRNEKIQGLTLQASNNCAFENFHCLLHVHNNNAAHQRFQTGRKYTFFSNCDLEEHKNKI